MESTINIEETINRAIKAAIREFSKEQKEENKSRIFHNTKLLMKHYNSLKLHADNAVYKAGDLEDLEDMEDYTDQDRIYISSIMRSKLRTSIMLSHVDLALEELKAKKTKENKYEQYKALELHYIDKHSYEQIESDLSCGKNTPNRWITSALQDLSILLFGVDGLKLDDMV